MPLCMFRGLSGLLLHGGASSLAASLTLLCETAVTGIIAAPEMLEELSKSQCWSKGFGLGARTLLLLLRSLHAQHVSVQQPAVLHMQSAVLLTRKNGQ